MKNLRIFAALLGGLIIGAVAFTGVQAKLPPPPAKSDAEKAAEADKAAAAKAKESEQNAKAQDRAVANYKKNKGIAMDTPKAAPAAKTTSKKK
jgi:hypothetical protein